jgi:hypothetical protein
VVTVSLHGRMSFAVHSFVLVGSKLVLYAIGAAALVAAASVISRGGRVRTLALSALGFGGLLAVAAAVKDPEALRHGLQFAYGWIPAAALAGVLVLGRRALRHGGEWTTRNQLELASVTALTVLAATTYPGFFPHAPYAQMAVYYMPLAAIFVARLHLHELARTRSQLALGSAWLVFLAAAGLGLTVHDAHRDSVVVRGPGGSLRETPAEAQLYSGALSWIERTTKPGDPILAAPMMTGLYPLSDRWSPLQELSLLPDALPAPADERRAIGTLERSGVRLVLTDDRTWPGFGQTSFGRSFDQALAGWIRTHFRVAGSVTIPPHRTIQGMQPERTIVVWLKRANPS